MTPLFVRVDEPAYDPHLLIARLRAHTVEPRECDEGWAIDVSHVDVVDELREAGRCPEEALCRAIVDQGRAQGTWAAVYCPQAGAPLTPLFSVIIPTRDRDGLLRAAVRSACVQLVTGIEIIVVDDASAEPVGPFDDPRVRVVRLPVQKGPAGARNAGLDVARGRFVAFLDDDDLWLPERLDLALLGLRAAPVAVCWTQHMGQRRGGRHRLLSGDVSRTILEDTTPCLGATAVHRDVAPRFDESFKGIEDVVWWWTLAHQSPVATVPRVGYLVRLHPAPRTFNTTATRVAENLTLLRTRPDIIATRTAAAHRWLRVGIMASEAGEHATALRSFTHHLRAQPSVRALAHVARAAGRRSLARLTSASSPARADELPPLRVLSLVASDQPRGAEGAAQFLAEELAHHGVVTRVVAVRGDESSRPRAAVDAVLTDDRHRSRPVALLTTIRSLRRELRAHPADVILAHGAQAAFIASVGPARRRRPPVVWQRILHLPSWPRRHPHRLWLGLAARRVSAVVAITETTDAEVRQLGFRGPVWHIPNHRPSGRFGVEDRQAARDSLRTELGIPDHAPLIGFVGHLVEQKNPVAAVEILDRLRRVHPSVELVLVGDGPLRGQVETAVRSAGLDDRVAMLGHREDVSRIMAAVDVLALTSHSESMPGVVIEAQLSGTPVVSYPVDGIDVALDPGRTGVVTRNADPAEAAQAVSDLLLDPARRDAMATEARTHSAGNTTARIAERYAVMLRSVVRSPDATRARVLHVLPDMGLGGAEQALAVLASTLDETVISQSVCVVSGARMPLAATIHADLQALGVPMCDLGVQRRPTRSMIGLVQASARIRKLARMIDATIVDAALLDASLPARLARLRQPLVTHLVNTPWSREALAARGGARWRDRLLELVDRWSARRDDVEIAITSAVADATRRDLKLQREDDRLVVIPRGVDLARFRPPTVPAPTVPFFDVVAVGRLVPQKGHDTLIAAVMHLRAEGVPVRLRIAGEGPLDGALHHLVAGAPPDTVEFLGPVRDIVGLLQTSSVFALASRWEGQSNAVVEAMAVGLPVLVSDIPALREVVGDAGILVPPNDEAAWAKALAGLLADPAERLRLGAAARDRVACLYDARICAARLGGVYLRLSGTTRSARASLRSRARRP